MVAVTAMTTHRTKNKSNGYSPQQNGSQIISLALYALKSPKHVSRGPKKGRMHSCLFGPLSLDFLECGLVIYNWVQCDRIPKLELRDRPEAWPRARLPAPAKEEAAPQVLPAEPLPQAPRE
eukprot:3732248-Amphidinium_carterae.1